MEKQPVVFVAFKEYDNLGVGYISAVLSDRGYDAIIIDFDIGKEEILNILKSLDPLLVGFSVIFQFNIDRFKELITYLRENGIKCHFTAGGHYASLRFEELFELIPSLDSIVRFEGEYTTLELIKSLQTGAAWTNTEGIAYRNDWKIIANQLRHPEEDLDKFPYPLRSEPEEYAFGYRFATIISGRGCIHDCAFCNLKEFFRRYNGPVKRLRKPELVVEEMEFLYNETGCSVFLFQDDDFPVKLSKETGWIERFCYELQSRGLGEKIMWKINCRPDEVEEKTFSLMKKNGLFLVFLGIEDGTDAGLKRLNKKMTIAASLEGIATLKRLKIGFDFGFILFQPRTSYRSLNDNIDFLKKVCGDGYTPVTFLKMIPFYETRVEKELISEGRIKGEPGYKYFDFLEESMDHFYKFIAEAFAEWLYYPDGLVNISKWARNYFAVYLHYYGSSPEVSFLSSNIKKIISESNSFLLDKMKELAEIFEARQYGNDQLTLLESHSDCIAAKHEDYKSQIHDTIGRLLRQNIKRQVYIQLPF